MFCYVLVTGVYQADSRQGGVVGNSKAYHHPTSLSIHHVMCAQSEALRAMAGAVQDDLLDLSVG